MQQRNLLIVALICLLLGTFCACSSSNRMGCPANKPYKYNRGY